VKWRVVLSELRYTHSAFGDFGGTQVKEWCSILTSKGDEEMYRTSTSYCKRQNYLISLILRAITDST